MSGGRARGRATRRAGPRAFLLGFVRFVSSSESSIMRGEREIESEGSCENCWGEISQLRAKWASEKDNQQQSHLAKGPNTTRDSLRCAAECVQCTLQVQQVLQSSPLECARAWLCAPLAPLESVCGVLHFASHSIPEARAPTNNSRPARPLRRLSARQSRPAALKSK